MKDRSTAHPAVSLYRPRRQPAHDVYGLAGKLSDPTGCPQCGAVYREGRWRWESMPFEAERVACPACRRTADRYPAGILSLRGAFVFEHAQEIESRLRNLEEHERSEHPLKRIIAIEADADGLRVTTTDARLARSLGNGLRRAFHGTLEQSRTDDQGPVRIEWCRD